MKSKITAETAYQLKLYGTRGGTKDGTGGAIAPRLLKNECGKWSSTAQQYYAD